MKTVALSLALALGLGFTVPMYASAADAPKGPVAQAPAPKATPAAKVDCTKPENKAHADCKVPAK